MKNFYIEYIKEYREQIKKGMVLIPSLFAIGTDKKTNFEAIGILQKNIQNNYNDTFNVYHDTTSIYLDNIEEYEFLYNNLCDEYSKKKYIAYYTHQTLNSQYYNAPFDMNLVKAKQEEVKKYKDQSYPSINDSVIGKLEVFNLKDLGYNIKLWINPLGLIIDFVLEQYRYKEILHTTKDDVVIDCGGAIGDTSLYFASKGASKVYVYEFVESSVELIKKQLKLNTHFENSVKIIENAVWEESNIELSYEDNGNSTFVGEKEKYSKKVFTLSIDDMVQEQKLLKVDLLKMDIEGAEYSALLGAEKTIKKYKPKLAISIYHKKDDLYTIPKLIKKILPEYDFYFDYYTDGRYEAMLYAVYNKSNI